MITEQEEQKQISIAMKIYVSDKYEYVSLNNWAKRQ
jgi:hypothetical protein